MLTTSSQDRFVELANTFFSGRYTESLTKANLFSTRNAFMLHSSWLAVLDLGDLIRKQFEGKVGTQGRTMRQQGTHLVHRCM